MIPIHRIERENASEAVSRQLLDLIRSGSLGIGDRLPAENDLAQAFGVSRPIVREALGALRGLGALTSINGRGNYVAPGALARPPLLGRYPVAELYEVRCHLEIPGAALASERRTSDQLANLASVVASLEACTDRNEWVRADAAFHVALAEATGNHVQARLVEHLRDLLIEQSQAIVIADPGRIPEATREHRAIYEAVAAEDSAAARAAMSAHLLAGSGGYDPEIRLSTRRYAMADVLAAHGIHGTEAGSGAQPAQLMSIRASGRRQERPGRKRPRQ
jgi:GntR family transcriptional repressor for pyruvate dehydrogenase complex